MKYRLKANNYQHDGDMKLKLFWSFQSLLLSQLNAHNTLNTYIYNQLLLTCYGVCYTIFRETIALLAQELYAIWNGRQIARKQNTYLVRGSEQNFTRPEFNLMT
jgi:hypothetical protein